MKNICVVIIVFLIVLSCKKDTETVLIIKEQYAPPSWPKEGLIKGDLYQTSFNKPLYSNLKTNNSREIKLGGLLEGTYLFRYYTADSPNSYWPVPTDTVFQIRKNEETTIVIK